MVRTTASAPRRFWTLRWRKRGPALSLCNAKERKPAGPRECEPESLSASPGQCGLAQGCAQPLELDDGTVVSVYSSDFVNCVSTGANQSRCDCSDDSGTFTFDVDAETTIDSCTQAGDIRSRRDEIEAGEDVACTIAEPERLRQRLQCRAQLQPNRHARGYRDRAASLPPGVLFRSGPRVGLLLFDHGSSVAVAVDVEAGDVWDVGSAAADACPGAIDIF